MKIALDVPLKYFSRTALETHLSSVAGTLGNCWAGAWVVFGSYIVSG